jgi:hypothetical protein
MHWTELEQAQPRLGELGQQRLIKPGVVLVGTIRRDGTPRLSPVEPLVLDGDLWLSMMWGSTKAADLLRDPRILVHSVITRREGTEGEFKIRGTARAEDDPAVQRRYADTVAASLGWDPEPGRFHLFAVDIGEFWRPVRGHLAARPGVRPPPHLGHQRGRPRAIHRHHSPGVTVTIQSRSVRFWQ